MTAAAPAPARLVCAVALACGSACVTPAAHVADAPDVVAGARMVDVRGAWLRVHEDDGAAHAEAAPVVFVHGYGSRLESWKLVQPLVAADGRRTVSFDQRGFGMSERPDGAYGPAAHAADLVALLDALHIERAVLVGHSYGAGVVLRAALEHPERVVGIVLVSPFALDEQITSTLAWARVPVLGEYLFTTSYRDFPGEKYLTAFAANDRGRFVSVAALDEVQAIQAREGSAYAALATVRGMDYASVEDRYASLAVPVTIVWGERDRITPIRTAPLFAQKLPRARLVRVPACGHMPPWERPDAVVDAIRALPLVAAPPSAPASAPHDAEGGP